MSTSSRRFFLLPLTILSLTFVLLLSCGVALAQGGVGSTRGLPGSSGGVHAIQGRIYFPAGRPVTQLRIRLESNSLGSNSTSSNSDGSFSFQSMVAGNYTVVIDAGEEYEPVREAVTIYGTSAFEGKVAPQTIPVNIVLRLKGSLSADSALAKVPKAAREFYEKGMAAAAKNDNKLAAEQLSSAVAAYPEFALALAELGVQYLRLNQPDKAVEPLKKAVELAPKDFGARLNYGIALSGKRNYAEAETQLRQAVTLNSAAPTAHMYLGITLLNLSRDEKKEFHADKYAEAQKELETAIASGKAEVAQAHRYLGGIYWGNKDYKRAADEFEVYLKLAPKAADAEKLRTAIKDLRSQP
jgi:tetratricopeptide (TPR) repeat protein